MFEQVANPPDSRQCIFIRFADGLPQPNVERVNTCQENGMSVILESLLDDERRAECRDNDGAMAMGRPIIASRSAIRPVERTSRPHPPQCERSIVARVATDELS